MDIDFHYYATYAAARFAGYTARDALTIATSAQMIDENGRHVLIDGTSRDAAGIVGLPDDFEVRPDPQGQPIHTYRVLMTFQGILDIGTSKNDSIASIWPVFHFLPGNFLPTRGLAQGGVHRADGPQENPRQGPAPLQSHRWSDRAFTGDKNVPTFTTVGEAKQKFRWLCRPHSPMATALVNNCIDMVRGQNDVVTKFNLEPYLVGVTSHVFADTWAHQDFMGAASQSMNRVVGGARVGWVPATHRKTLPSFVGDRSPTLASLGAAVAPIDRPWRGTSPYLMGGEERNIYVGHGQAGHWPDHSSLIWEYTPGWSATPVVRNNPAEYFDAFLHLAWAMHCIRNNLQYVPFDVTDSSVGTWCSRLDVSRDRLLATYELLCRKREPFGLGSDPDVPSAISDEWDRSIFAYGREWQGGVSGALGLGTDDVPTDWLPGRSRWVVQALEAYKANQVLVAQKQARGGRWYTAQQFLALDFFRFNLAAKIHYRTVKQQLLAFNEQLLGHWPDGAAYADDLERVKQGLSNGAVGTIITEVGDVQRTAKKRETNEGMAVLVQDLAACDTAEEAVALLERVIASIDAKESWTYGVLDEAGKTLSSDAEKKLRAILAKAREGLGNGGTRPRSGPRKAVVLPTQDEWKSRSSVTFGRRSKDSRLVVIDERVGTIQQYRSGSFQLGADGARIPTGSAQTAATQLIEACEAWLEANRTGEGGDKGRRGAVAWLRDTVRQWSGVA